MTFKVARAEVTLLSCGTAVNCPSVILAHTRRVFMSHGSVAPPRKRRGSGVNINYSESKTAGRGLFSSTWLSFALMAGVATLTSLEKVS